MAFATGCSSDKTSMSESKGDQRVVAVNKTCPVGGEAVNPAVHESYKGKTVGFCCTKCESKWDNMTDAQKDEAFKKAMAAK
jgi:hypothetical protein